MSPSALHQQVKISIKRVVSPRHRGGIRRLLECGSTEGFLRDLLAIQLTTNGQKVVREKLSGRYYIDLVLSHESTERETYIETKQLLLNGGARYVVNILNDLKRHEKKDSCFGVVYVVDRSHSEEDSQFKNDANRTGDNKEKLNQIIVELQTVFPCVHPSNAKQAMLRRFAGKGHVDLYAFVVCPFRDADAAL